MTEIVTLDSAWGTPEEPQGTAADLRRQRLSTLVRRSILILPVNVPRFVEKAYARGADAIQLDLEDSVRWEDKGTARELVRHAVAICAKGGADVIVRINKPYELAMKDLAASVWPGVAAIHFPKAETAREIEWLDAAISELESSRRLPPGSVKLSVAVETALGLHNALGISLASPRITDIVLGPEDYALDIGVEPSVDGRELFYGKAKIVVDARLAGIQPLGTVGSVANYGDLETWEASARFARQMGYLGAYCIHPNQVAILNRHFSPSEAEARAAEAILVAYEAARREGRGAVGVDGKMIDVPVAARARRTLDRVDAIRAREGRTRAAFERLGETPPEGAIIYL